jgi:DNA-binding PadR family transcriptional regulator
MFRFIVLGLLRNGGTLHGYALMKAYRSRTGVQMSTGTFYRELQSLVAEGLVRIVDRAPDDDARRTPYQITAVGSDTFDRWLVRPPLIVLGSDDELTARTMFLDEAEPGVARRMIDAWKEELWLLSKKFERDRQSELHRCSEDGSFSILSLLLARRLRHLAGDVEYLDELQAALATLPAAEPAAPVTARPSLPRPAAVTSTATRRR